MSSINHKNQIKTFGCRLNLLESDLIEKNLVSLNKEILIVNTCAVTNEAEKQAKQFIRKASRENPNIKIIATGCAVQIDSKNWSEMPEVFKTVGNVDKIKKDTWVNIEDKEQDVSNIMLEKILYAYLCCPFSISSVPNSSLLVKN